MGFDVFQNGKKGLFYNDEDQEKIGGEREREWYEENVGKLGVVNTVENFQSAHRMVFLVCILTHIYTYILIHRILEELYAKNFQPKNFSADDVSILYEDSHKQRERERKGESKK